MKRLLITMLTVVALGLNAAAQTGKGSHGTQQDTAAIVMYSDTTSTDTTASAATAYSNDNGEDNSIKVTFKDVSDPFNLIAYLTTIGAGGVVVAIFFVILCLLTVFSPVILVAIVLYLVFKRKRERYRIVEKAMETGQPIPDEMRRTETMSPDMLWRKGIKNASIGLGIVALALCLDWDFLVGFGLIMVFYGGGQAVISRTTGKKNDKTNTDDNGEIL